MTAQGLDIGGQGLDHDHMTGKGREAIRGQETADPDHVIEGDQGIVVEDRQGRDLMIVVDVQDHAVAVGNRGQETTLVGDPLILGHDHGIGGDKSNGHCFECVSSSLSPDPH